jgi:hypothetical protein
VVSDAVAVGGGPVFDVFAARTLDEVEAGLDEGADVPAF